MLMKNFLRITNYGLFNKLTKFNFLTKNILKPQIFINKSAFKFSTGNTVGEKNALEYIEAGVFEVLKGTAKCKTDKLNRTATLEDLG